MNKSLTVIIPVHSVSGDFKEYFKTAILSIKNSIVKPFSVIIVHPSEITKALKDFDYGDLNVVFHTHNEKNCSFQNQINIGAKQVTTEYFSFLEFDDEYSNNWFKNVTDYITENQNVEMFLPIISDVNEKNEFLSYSNEIAWALNFTNELGYLDFDSLMEYPNINISGMVIKTAAFLESGGLKPNIRLSFNYEFLLRFLNLSNKILVIPKVGYKHTNMRKDSLFWSYKYSDGNIISPEEAKFWMKAATTEYYHKIDREITYS